MVTRLTRMGVRLEPSRSSKPLMKAAADICRAGGKEGGKVCVDRNGAAVHTTETTACLGWCAALSSTSNNWGDAGTHHS